MPDAALDRSNLVRPKSARELLPEFRRGLPESRVQAVAGVRRPAIEQAVAGRAL